MRNRGKRNFWARSNRRAYLQRSTVQNKKRALSAKTKVDSLKTWWTSCLMEFFVLLMTLVLLMNSPQAFSADTKAGKTIYDKNKCGVCHGKTGVEGTKMGGPLKKFDTKRYKDAIVKGVKPKMPAYDKKIKGADLGNLMEYLKNLSK